MRIRISGKDLENLRYIMGYEISVPKAIAATNRTWKSPVSQKRQDEIADFMRKMFDRLTING